MALKEYHHRQKRIAKSTLRLGQKGTKYLGAIWRPRYKMWEMSYDDALALGLADHVAA